MKALLALLALLLFLVPSQPVVAQGVDPGIVCATNSVPVPLRESRVFCEPLDSVGFVQFDQFVAGVNQLAADYPDFVEVRQIGTSVQGSPTRTPGRQATSSARTPPECSTIPAPLGTPAPTPTGTTSTGSSPTPDGSSPSMSR
jgi:hypothetical protein